MKNRVGIGAIVILYALLAVAIAAIIHMGGNYPVGSDTMCHVYKGDALFQSIKEGSWYPLYDKFWYNGVQMMRYWAPLPVYFLAMCQAIAGGNIFNGYLVFVALVFFFGALVWLYIGVKKDRIILGTFLGVLWFFMPNNLYALFVEGNLPRTLSMVLLPVLIYCIHEYLFEDEWKKVKVIIPVFTGIALCHVGYAGMIALAILIFLLVYKIMWKEKGKALTVIVSLVLPFLIIGIWLYASLKGGITSTDSSQVMQGFFQDAIYSLNPFLRITEGPVKFYFGLAAFLTAVFGGICSRKKSSVGFITAIVIFICTTTSMYAILVKLPGSQYLWMLRFISIALCLILYSFLTWETLKKGFVILCCVLLALDVIPSLSLVYNVEDSGKTAIERMEEQADMTLISKAKEITNQRVALMDESSLGATAQYLLIDFGSKKVQGTFGAGWQSAATAHNIVQLNEAMFQGCYLYMFDRALELGNDTVLIRIDKLKYPDEDIEKVHESAQKRGYQLIDSNSDYLLYHYDTYDTFGTVCEYNGIGIGTSASLMALNNPDMKEGESDNINDYSFDKLKKYKIVYLAGFTYDNKNAAEDLILRLSNAGVKIVIDGDGIPSENESGTREFLGVTCHSIMFENGYPILYTESGETDCYLFDKEYSNWKTVYFNGLDNSQGYLYDNNLKVDFLGTKNNENIVFIGLNLTFHYSLTHDEEAGKILNQYIGQYLNEIPDRETVPMEVEYGKDSIKIVSDRDNVNTALAYHDIFFASKEIESKNSLTYVDKGTTIITMKYPYLAEGMVLSGLGIIFTILFIVRIRKKYLHKGENIVGE